MFTQISALRKCYLFWSSCSQLDRLWSKIPCVSSFHFACWWIDPQCSLQQKDCWRHAWNRHHLNCQVVPVQMLQALASFASLCVHVLFKQDVLCSLQTWGHDETQYLKMTADSLNTIRNSRCWEVLEVREVAPRTKMTWRFPTQRQIPPCKGFIMVLSVFATAHIMYLDMLYSIERESTCRWFKSRMRSFQSPGPRPPGQAERFRNPQMHEEPAKNDG